MSANSHASPLHYKELEDSFGDANFKVDISQKMKVPNKLSFNENGVSHNNWSENIDMQVPERILAMGQHQFMGTRSGPREIDFDHSLMATSDPYPCDPRVATPPRTLTLDRYPFPGIDSGLDEQLDEPRRQQQQQQQIPVAQHRPAAAGKYNNASMMDESELHMSIRESTPPLGRGPEEVAHLRKQLAKLNRRVVALELEGFGRVQRDKIMYGIGLAYFLLKTIIWLNRN